MMSGKPLLVSSSAPLKRLIEKHQAGLVFEAGNYLDFADKVKVLYTNSELRNQLSKNGIKASLEGDLNWETTQQELINLYQSLSK